ncbi:glycoside-pentoside-hexuronide (GPH):cation symporter [Anaerococcus porci]|uniref:MFS transporter n=1 Tax=Anaerococcus porci TaxID=2652269 RepID=UPI002A748330|nr:glycoside-pentoside-hexuronide (GPH):cation symporter [Anaerococcus porci]MDY3005685.1 glycoside-pentoside-hexuronide (GPH):cation symporter [Anaerococcus porci]
MQDKNISRDKEYIVYVESASSFSIKDKLGYMFGDLGGNTLQVIVNTYLLLFMTSIVGIRAGHFAIIVAVCKALDSLNDPFIGRFTDKAAGTKYGKYNNIIRKVSVPMAIMTVMLFIDVSGFPYGLKVAWCLIIYFLWGVISSFWNIPYGTMLNSISQNQEQRAELSNFRSIGSLGANVIVQTAAPLLIFNNLNEATAQGFLILSIIGGVFSIICLFFTTRWARERIVITTSSEKKQAVNYKKLFLSFLKNRPMISIILAYIIVKFFIQTTGITNQYVFQVYFGETKTLAYAGIAQMIPMIMCMPLLKPLLKKFGKKNLITWPMIIAAVLYGLLAFVKVSPMAWVIIQGIASFFTGFYSLLIWSLIADGVDYHVWLTGERNDGMVYSIVTFVVFLVASLSTTFITLLLSSVGFQPLLQAMQAPGVAENIRHLSAILPAIGCVLIFLIFTLIYNLSDKDMEKISIEVGHKAKIREEELEEELEDK